MAIFSPPAGAQPTLSTLQVRSVELEISLGAFDDPVLAFSRISDLTVDPDGRLYVLQPIEGVVTVLAPDGSLHERVGRKGQGPGEFLSPAAVGWRGDTLWVMDLAQQRIAWFRKGDHVRTDRFIPVQEDRGDRTSNQWPMADGSYWTLLARRFEHPAGHPDNFLPILRTTPNREETSLVAALRESFPFRLVIEHSEGLSYGSPLFSDFPLLAQDDRGRRLAIVDRPFGTEASAPIRVTVVESSGDTAYSHEYTVDVVPLTDRQWDAKIQEALAKADRPNRPWGRRELEAASRRPTHWATATRAVQGADSRTLVALADLPWADEREWVAFNEEGRPLFRVVLPRTFDIYTASGDLIWGIWKDEFGIPYVRRYRLGELVRR